MAKKTEAIKERLQAYTESRRDYEMQIERLQRMAAASQYKSPSFEPMPGGGSPSKDKIADAICELIELENQLKDDKDALDEERRQIDALIRKMKKADERAIIRMKYFDGMGWTDIAHAIYHREEDFKQAVSAYQQKAYKLHGAALLSLAKIYNKKENK